MNPLRPRANKAGGGLQTPLAALVCNFAAPTKDQDARLSHDEVLTLFHEFGHGMHLLLTQVDEPTLAGISGVEWDAVELPSQFMENFGWEWDVVQGLSAEAQAAGTLPRALFEKLLSAKNFQSGLQLLRHVQLATFDMLIHAEPEQATRIQTLFEEVHAAVAVTPLLPCARFAYSFNHIFAGGYAAGYYSYLWAEVLSADAWGAFEEEGVFNPLTGQRYLAEILEVGGSRDAAVNFMAFRGRAVQTDALLRQRSLRREAFAAATHAIFSD